MNKMRKQLDPLDNPVNKPNDIGDSDCEDSGAKGEDNPKRSNEQVKREKRLP